MIEILPGVFVTTAQAVKILTVLVSHIKIEPVTNGHTGSRLPAEQLTLIDDVLDVWPSGELKASSARLAELLSDLISDRYRGLRGSDLSQALRPFKRQVWVSGANVQGFWRKELEVASWSQPS